MPDVTAGPDGYDATANDVARRFMGQFALSAPAYVRELQQSGLARMIAHALRQAAADARAEQREADAMACDRIYRDYGEAVRMTETDAGHQLLKARAGGAGECAAAIRKGKVPGE